MNCKLINTDKGSFIDEYIFTGHNKSVKSIKQAFFNENVFVSCGRDGIIYLWDIRNRKSGNNLRNMSKRINEFKKIFKKNMSEIL